MSSRWDTKAAECEVVIEYDDEDHFEDPSKYVATWWSWRRHLVIARGMDEVGLTPALRPPEVE